MTLLAGNASGHRGLDAPNVMRRDKPCQSTWKQAPRLLLHWPGRLPGFFL